MRRRWPRCWRTSTARRSLPWRASPREGWYRSFGLDARSPIPSPRSVGAWWACRARRWTRSPARPPPSSSAGRSTRTSWSPSFSPRSPRTPPSAPRARATRGSGPGSTPVAGALVRGVALVVAACAVRRPPPAPQPPPPPRAPTTPGPVQRTPSRAPSARAPQPRPRGPRRGHRPLRGRTRISSRPLPRHPETSARAHALLPPPRPPRRYARRRAFRGRTSRASRPHRMRLRSPRRARRRALLAGCVAWSRPNLGVEGGGGFRDAPRGRRGRARGGGIRRHDGHRRVRCRRRGGGGGERRGRAFTISTTR